MLAAPPFLSGLACWTWFVLLLIYLINFIGLECWSPTFLTQGQNSSSALGLEEHSILTTRLALYSISSGFLKPCLLLPYFGWVGGMRAGRSGVDNGRSPAWAQHHWNPNPSRVQGKAIQLTTISHSPFWRVLVPSIPLGWPCPHQPPAPFQEFCPGLGRS